jgi:hypothetical protein
MMSGGRAEASMENSPSQPRHGIGADKSFGLLRTHPNCAGSQSHIAHSESAADSGRQSEISATPIMAPLTLHASSAKSVRGRRPTSSPLAALLLA